MLVRLLYASRAAKGIDDALVASILESSQKHNAEHGITGILCTYAPGNAPPRTFNDEIRRMQVSKTILLRNTRI